jgi:3-isopropylmalate dehydratase
MSPAMAAAAAVTGKLKDVRALGAAPNADKVAMVKEALDSKLFYIDKVVLPQNFTPSQPEEKQPEKKISQSAEVAQDAPPGMPKFVTLDKAITAPLRRDNVDTDCIIPKQFLKTIKRTGLGSAAFFELRYEDDGVTEKPDFVLNKPQYRKSTVLIAGDNFGCGSSREHAPWALNDQGIRCIVAPSFADIFFNNCFKNGMLPIPLAPDKVETLMCDAEAEKKLTIDLPNQKIIRECGDAIPFEVHSFSKHCLINGLDDIGLTLQKKEHIDKFEGKRTSNYPWLDGVQYSRGVAEVKVTASKSSKFYARAIRGFLAGLGATDQKEERPPAAKVVVTATGAAIERAATAAYEVEATEEAEVTSVRTDFLRAPGGKKDPTVPQIIITLESRCKATQINAAPFADKAGCGCGGGEKSKATDW